MENKLNIMSKEQRSTLKDWIWIDNPDLVLYCEAGGKIDVQCTNLDMIGIISDYLEYYLEPHKEPVEEELEKSEHEYPHYYKKGESKCVKCGVEKETADKLPEVGKRYKDVMTDAIITVVEIKETAYNIVFTYNNTGGIYGYKLDDFWKEFEELS